MNEVATKGLDYKLSSSSTSMVGDADIPPTNASKPMVGETIKEVK